ncbi:glycosyltransferase [Chitinimonas lacunae]|uniref:Glycosyltransferase n=1 Tax=Chitinimonas lacunae TaxID=1963018 RepID=A0ABV8MYH3_9NEIS
MPPAICPDPVRTEALSITPAGQVQPIEPAGLSYPKVLHIGKYYPPFCGGMEQFLADLVAAAPEGSQSVLVHNHQNQALPDPVWLYRAPVWRRLLFTPISFHFPRYLLRALREQQPEVLHLHLPNPAAFWVLLLPAARRLPWVVHWHSDVVASQIAPGLRWAYLLYRPFERWLLARADRIVATSAAYLEASEPLARERDKCRVVPLGFDRARLPAPGPDEADWAASCWPTTGLRLLTVGRLTYYKGHAALIRVLAAVEDAQLLVVGDGEEREALQALIEELGLGKRVRLMGGLDDARRNALLADCDVFCLPSIERTEAFGVVLMEAMQYRRPLLVSAIPGSGTAWVAGAAALALPPDQPAAWAAALRLLRDPRLRAELAAAAAARVAGLFDIGQVVRGLEQVYAELFKSPRQLPSRPMIVIPARDEAATVGTVVSRLRQQGWRDIVVVNDQSRDDTAAIAAAAGAAVISPVLPQGAWGAMQTGIRYALGRGFDAVVTMDADGQHDSRFLPLLLDGLARADIVIGSHPDRVSPARRFAWKLFRTISGLALQDLTSGYRAYNLAAMKVVAGEEATLLDHQDIGVLILARKAGLEAYEVPVTMCARSAGGSRIFHSWWAIFLYMIETVLLCCARWGVKPPRCRLRQVKIDKQITR